MERKKRLRWKRGDTHKMCVRCNESKSVDEFQLRRNGDEARQAYCRSCNSNAGVEWAKKKPERHKNNVSAWRAANHDRSNELALQGYYRNWDRNKEKGRTRYKANAANLRQKRRVAYHANKELEKNKYREWRLKNPARNAHKSMMYEARKKRAMPSWADKEAILAVYEKCAEINKTSAVKYQVDHIYPLCSPIMCGLHVHYNLQIIPAALNQSKSNRVMAEFDAVPNLCGDRPIILYA